MSVLKEINSNGMMVIDTNATALNVNEKFQTVSADFSVQKVHCKEIKRNRKQE